MSVVAVAVGAIGIGTQLYGAHKAGKASKKAAKREAAIAEKYGRQSIALSYAQQGIDTQFAGRSKALAAQDLQFSQQLIGLQKQADHQSLDTKKRMLFAEANMSLKKLEDLDRAKETIVTQSKADKMMRTEAFNNQMSHALVKGAASGRVLGEGSMQKGFNKASEDRAWERHWNTNMLTQDVASFARDKINLLEKANFTVKWGLESLDIEKMANQVSYSNTAFQMQSSYNRAIMSADQTVAQAGFNQQQSELNANMSIESGHAQASNAKAQANAAMWQAGGSAIGSLGSLYGSSIKR